MDREQFIREKEKAYGGKYLGAVKEGEVFPLAWEGKTIKITAFPPYSTREIFSNDPPVDRVALVFEIKLTKGEQ